jgi:plasmid maintenance system killer protein
MKSVLHPQFRKAFGGLPSDIREQARRAYRLFRDNPFHTSLHFKALQQNKPFYSVRINRNYRAVGLYDGDTIIWFWIGTHSEYDKLISQL